MDSRLHPGTRIARNTDSPESTIICSSIATKPTEEPGTKVSSYKEAKDESKSESKSTLDQGSSSQSSLRKGALVPNEHPTSGTRDSSRCLDQTSDDNDSSEFEDIFYSPLEYSDDEELIFNPKRMEKLGSGGFGACYKTSRIPDGLDIAVKISTIDDEYYDNAWNVFYTELEFYERMHQLNKNFRWLPQYYGSGTLQGRPWIAMELLKMSVHQSNTLGCMHPHLFKICALGALRALEALHKTGHIHRDIKPENLALRHLPDPTPSNEQPPSSLEIVLIDFGLVRSFSLHNEDDTFLNDFEEFWGTIEYASERQLREQQLGPGDDLESLCYTLLELWLGKQWWSATETKNIEKPQHAAPPPSKDHQSEHASGKLNRKRLRKYSSCSSKVTAQRKKVSNRHSYAQINLAPKSKGDTVHATAQCNHLKSLKLRSQAWNNLVVQGQVPNFLITWRNYCKGLDAKTFPDYEYLADLIHCAPVKLDKAATGVDVKPHQPGLQDLASRREE